MTPIKGKSRKIIIISILALTILAATAILGAGALIAKEKGIYPSVVTKLAERFNLDIDEVKKVFDEEHEAKCKDHQKILEAKLEDAVEKGKITEKQKEAILKKLKEMKTKMTALRDLPLEERRRKIKINQAEMQEWARDNKIDLPLMRMRGRGFMHGPYGGRKGFGHNPFDMLP